MQETLPAPAPTATADRLPLRTRLAFGAGDLAPAIATIILGFFQLFFLTTVAGLSPAAVGTMLLFVQLWDAINDPLVGWLSDRTHSPLGRRRPWILYGAVPFGLTFFLLWIVPPFEPGGLYAYYLVMLFLFNIAFTVVNVPYTAMTPELTQDYDERTSLNSYRFAFSIGGSLIAGVLHQVIVTSFADPRTGYMVAGAIWGLVCIPPFFWCVFGTRERYREASERPHMNILAQVRAAFSCKPYLFVVGIYLTSWLAVQMTSAVLAFYATFWLRMEELIPLMLFAVQGTAFVFLFVWSAVSRRIGKKAVYMIGMVIWIGVQSVLFFVQPGQVGLAVGLAVLAGIGVATAYLIPWSMMPDVIEFDEWETGERREGVFYGFMVFLQKIGLGLGLFLVGVLLEARGFNQNLPANAQPESALLAIRLLIGPIPTAVLICGIVLTAFYPITKERFVQVQAALEERRNAAQ